MKAVSALAGLMFIVSPFAEGSLVDQQQGQQQGQIGINKQGQAQGQAQGQIGINKSKNINKASSSAYSSSGAYQAQGQIGLQGNKQDSDITINEDSDTEVVTAVWPVTPSTEGKEERSIYSIFGGVGNNKTEEHLRIVHQMQVAEKLYKDGVIDKETYTADTQDAYNELKAANANPKLLGLFPVARRGCSVVNACGLLNFKNDITDAIIDKVKAGVDKVSGSEPTDDSDTTFTTNVTHN